jgi:hypothetical protein
MASSMTIADKTHPLGKPSRTFPNSTPANARLPPTTKVKFWRQISTAFSWFRSCNASVTVSQLANVCDTTTTSCGKAPMSDLSNNATRQSAGSEVHITADASDVRCRRFMATAAPLKSPTKRASLGAKTMPAAWAGIAVRLIVPRSTRTDVKAPITTRTQSRSPLQDLHAGRGARLRCYQDKRLTEGQLALTCGLAL